MYQDIKHISVILLDIKRQQMMRGTLSACLLAPREQYVKKSENPKER